MSEKDLETAMKAIMTAKRGEAGPPSPDELLRYRSGLLTEEDREVLLEQAAASPETARALLDAGRFPGVEPTADQERMTEADVDRQWQRFEERLRQEAPSRAPETRPTPAAGRRWLASLFNSLRFAQAAAAALLLVSLGLSWSLATRPDDAGPRLNLPIVELVPENEAGERAEAEGVRVPAAADGILVVLTLRERRPYPAYEVKIRDPAGAVAWSSTALRRDPEGIFTLELPRDLLPAGRYRIALRGVDGELRDSLADYRLVIEEVADR